MCTMATETLVVETCWLLTTSILERLIRELATETLVARADGPVATLCETPFVWIVNVCAPALQMVGTGPQL